MTKGKGFIPKKHKKLSLPLRLKGDYYFTISIESEIKDSWVTCWILNLETRQTATLDFHLYSRNGMGYAEVKMPTKDRYLYEWVGDNIQLISPMVCRAVLTDSDLTNSQSLV